MKQTFENKQEFEKFIDDTVPCKMRSDPMFHVWKNNVRDKGYIKNKPTKDTKRFFLTFYFIDHKRRDGFGNAEIDIDREIELEDIRKIEEIFAKKGGHRIVVITNITPLSS